MDKLYKVHFLSQLKARMPLERPEFLPHNVPKGHPLRPRFAGSSLYLYQLPSQHCVWLEWFPGEGVEREFYAFLGWSFNSNVLPVNQPGDMRIYSINEPSVGLASGCLNVQAVEGRQAIAGFKIATPWDQLYSLSPRVPEQEQKRVMEKAYTEYLAVTDTQRVEAVRSAMNEAFNSIASVLPRFISALKGLTHDA